VTCRHKTAVSACVLLMTLVGAVGAQQQKYKYGEEPLRAGPRPTERVVLPPDAAASDPALAEWRRRLLEAVARRDFDGLHDSLNSGLKYQWYFSERTSIPRSTFIAEVRALSGDKQEELWRDINSALRLPMSVMAEGEGAYSPYLGALLDPLMREWEMSPKWPYATVLVLANGVRMRAAPFLSAAVVDTLSFETVRTLDDDSCTSPVTIDGFSYCWQRVESARGVEGWIVNRYAFGQGSFWMTVIQWEGRWGISEFHKSDLR
jgi:hypothetical protein